MPSDKSLFHKIETVLNIQTDVKSQVSTLVEMVISLQSQMNALNSKLDPPPPSDTVTVNSTVTQNQSCVIVDRDENSPLTTQDERPTVTPGESSYSKVVTEGRIDNNSQTENSKKSKSQGAVPTQNKACKKKNFKNKVLGTKILQNQKQINT